MTPLIAGVAAFAVMCCSFLCVAFGVWLLHDMRLRDRQQANEERRRAK